MTATGTVKTVTQINLTHYRPQTKFAKVMFLHVSVCPRGVSRPRPRGRLGVWLEGVSRPRPRGSLGGCPDPHLGGCTGPDLGGVSKQTLRQTPPSADGYCCWRYSSYWNAFSFFIISHSQVLLQYRVVIFNGNSIKICKNLFFLATSLHRHIYNIIHIYNLICYIDNIIIRIYHRRAF